MSGLRHKVHHRYLVSAECAFYGQAIDYLRTSPAFQSAQDYHRPLWPFLKALAPCLGLYFLNFRDNRIECRGHFLVNFVGIVSLNEIGSVTVTPEELVQFFMTDASQHGGSGYLVTIQMQDGQYGSITNRIEEFVRVPTGGHWTGFRLTVTNNAGYYQAGVVECCTIGM